MSDKEYNFEKWIRKAATVMLCAAFIALIATLIPLTVRDIGKKLNERKEASSADSYSSDSEYTIPGALNPGESIRINKNVDKKTISDIKDKEEIKFSITVTNTGGVPLNNIKFEDDTSNKKTSE